MIGSTHMHSTGSDGKLTPEQVIKKTIILKWDYIYFTDHYFKPPKFPLRKEKYNDYFNKDYVREVKKLKEKYKDEIEVGFGVEMDWLEDYEDWLKKESKKEDYDYVIGSIHDLKTSSGEYRGLEYGKDYWLKTAEKFGSAKAYVTEYYKQIKNLVKSGIFDSVGHFDYIRVSNADRDLFSENAGWYKKEVLETLDLIKENKMVLEINASGLRKCKSQFPSLWILKEAKKRNIPVTIGLDAHWEEHFDNKMLKKLFDVAREAGYKEVVTFKKRKINKEKLVG